MAEKTPRIGIVGDRNPKYPVHIATENALHHVAEEVSFEWIPTDRIVSEDEMLLSRFSGLLVAPGSPYRSMDGALKAISHARREQVPLLGTCGGFQHLIIEFIRNVLAIPDADHEETNPGAPRLAITALACSLAGQEHLVRFLPGTRTASLYGTQQSVEPFLCSYGLNSEYRSRLESAGLRVSGLGEDSEVRVVELSGHPFFLGTLFVPQARSKPGMPHPLVSGLVAAAKSRAAAGT